MTTDGTKSIEAGTTSQVDRHIILSGNSYRDPIVFDQEKKNIFFRSWKYVAHESELPKPGSFIVSNVLDQSILLIRGDDLGVRAFYNVCQHRAHELLVGSGTVNAIRCPYHAWTYDLRGGLRYATRASRQIKTDHISLTDIRIEAISGFLFVNLDRHAAPLSQVASGFHDELKCYVPEISRLKKVGYWCEEREANWKLIIENDVECYHCQTAHPYLSSRIDLNKYRSVDSGIYTTHLIDDSETGGNENPFVYWFLWPDTEARVMPGPTNFAIYTMEPLSPTRTRLHYHHFVEETASTTDIEQIRHNPDEDPTVAEDVALVESVQRGLSSMGYHRSRFVDDPESVWTEHSVHHFQLLVAEALGNRANPTDEKITLCVSSGESKITLFGRWINATDFLAKTPSPLACGTLVEAAIGDEHRTGEVIHFGDVELTCGMTIRFF